MTEAETMIVVFVALLAVAGFVYYKFKQAEARLEAVFEETARREREARHAEFKRVAEESRRKEAERVSLRKAFPVEKNVIPTTEQVRSFHKPTSGFAQPLRTTSRSVSSTHASSPATVVDNSGNDLLTAMIIQNALNSSHYTPSTTHYSNTSNPVDFPAATPEPSYSSSYSSPDSDESSSRSSYSSSYSSSSSDSSYSSSSSDSSYSSSSDSSSSSSD